MRNATTIADESTGPLVRLGRRLVRIPVARPSLTLFLLAVAVRMIHIGRSPLRDEFFHVLAARSLLADGDLIIDGHVPYSRAWPFTYLVAALFRLFGDSLVVARLPGVLAGASLVAAVFLWTRANVNSRAAWAAALLVCFDSMGILLSQLDRFYGLHAFLFFLGAIGVYGAVTQDIDRRKLIIRLLLAVLALYLSFVLHLITVIGIIAILAWLVLARGPAWSRRLAASPRRKWIIATVVVAAVAVAAAGNDMASVLWRSYQFADDWALGRSEDLLFYHRALASTYPTLWSLFPVILGIALLAVPAAAGFCGVVFVCSVMLLSFGAMKSDRYIFFVMPFLFILAGIAIGVAIPWIRAGARRILARSGWLGRHPNAAAASVTAALAGALVFAVGSNRGLVRTAQMLGNTQADESVFGWRPNWNDATPALRSLADSASLVLGSWPLATWYYLDRLDVSLHQSDLTRDEGRLPEFAVPPWYLPRPTISEPESLAQLIACSPSGLVIVERTHWRNPWQVTDEMADFMAANLERVPLDERWGLVVFRWREGGSDVPKAEADCPSTLNRAPRDSAARIQAAS